MRDNAIGELIDRINERTLQYAMELGVQLDSNGFVSCLWPDHEDRDPSMKYWDEVGKFHCFGCLPGDEKVYTVEKGLLAIKDIKTGMHTLGVSGKPNKVLRKDVIDAKDKAMFEISLYNSRKKNKFTSEHVHMIVKKNDYENSKESEVFLREVTTEKLESGDFLFFPKTKVLYDGTLNNNWFFSDKTFAKNFDKITLNEDICWLIGVYLAEGSTAPANNPREVRWTIGKDSFWMAEKIKKIVEKNFKGLNVTIHDRSGTKSAYDVSCSSKFLVNFLIKYFGKLCDKKYIDNYFLHIDYKLQMSIFEGLYDGDGNKNENSNMIKLTSENIIDSCKQFLVNNNLTYSYTETKTDHKKNVYSLRVLKRRSERFFFLKNDSLNGMLIKIKSIDEIDNKEDLVYDITTEDSTFKVKDYIVHNCGRFVGAIDLAHIYENKPIAGPDFIEENVFYLAQKFGEPYEHLRKELTAEELKKQQYYRTMKLFEEYVVANMNIEYLEKRNITKETAQKLSIGAVKSFDDCVNFLISSGCNREIVKDIGIDSFKVNDTKMILIIKNEYGGACSFVSRDMFWSKEKGGPKYINGNSTEIFNKSRIFYGWSDVKKEYNPLVPLVILEGYIDQIQAYQRGIKNTVALGSASFTDDHINIIEKDRRIRSVAFGLDQDYIGKKRMESIMLRLRGNETTKNYQFAIYKQSGKDVDEILSSNPEFKKTSDMFELKSLFEYQLLMLKSHHGNDLDESQLFDEFVTVISKTKTPKEREEQARVLSNYLTRYSYNTILEQVSHLIDGKEILYKDEIKKMSKRAIDEITMNPQYAKNIVESLSEDINEIGEKYNKKNRSPFESALEMYRNFEDAKTNANLFEVDFGMPLLNNVNIAPGNSILLCSTANTGKSSIYQNLVKFLLKLNDNTTIFYCSTDDPGEKIYSNLMATFTGMMRDYCSNPYFHKIFGLNKSESKESFEMFELYQKVDEYFKLLITQKRLVILDVKSNIDNWREFEKTVKDIASDKDMENQYKILIVDSANKIMVDGYTDENATAGFLSANIKKISERYKFLSFINFELNKTKGNQRLSQYSLSGSRRMFYDCDILSFVYNPTKNLQEQRGTDTETQMVWNLTDKKTGYVYKMPILVTVEAKSKAGDNPDPYFYKLNTINNQVTPMQQNTEEYKQYLEVWRYEFQNYYQ